MPIPPPLSFGLVVPPTSKAHEHFDALAIWLRDTQRLDVKTLAVPTYEKLATSIGEGAVDIAWMPPVIYAWFAEAVTPIGSILRDGQSTYSAALVVREDSALHALSDLTKVRAGWVDPWSAAGYVVPRLELDYAAIDPRVAFRSEAFYGNHRDALFALGRSECDVVGTYAHESADGAPPTGAWSDLDDLRVRVLATFGAIPTDVIAVRRNLAPRDYERTARALQEACAEEAARPLVRAVFGGEDFRAGIEPGHDVLRRAYERGLAKGLFD